MTEETKDKEEADETDDHEEISIKELKDEIKQKEERINEIENIAQRTKADFQNYKKRMNKKLDKKETKAKKNLAKDLLDVIDSFENAIESLDEPSEDVVEGLKNTHRLLRERLEEHGLEIIEKEGEKFDPQIHKAVGKVKTEEHDSEEIVEVIQNGYKFNDITLRPALVKVAENTSKKSNS